MHAALILILSCFNQSFGLRERQKNVYLCKKPLGKLGEKIYQGCYEYTCTGEGKTGWKKTPVCLDFKAPFSGRCLSCPPLRPYCVGPCLHGRCLTGLCSPFDLPLSRSCPISAGEVADSGCKTDCGENTNTCRGCLQENMPDVCTSQSTFGCFSCAASIIKAYSKCRTSTDVLLCLSENLSSDCIPCVCTLACALFGGDSTICKICKGEEASPAVSNVADFLAPAGYGSDPPPTTIYKCPQGWSISQDPSPKCFKVYTALSEGSWIDAQETFCPGISAQLAVADTDDKISAIANALAVFGKDTQSWIAGRKDNSGFDWVPLTGAPFSIGNSPNFLDGCPKTISGSCLYVDTSGRWCNDKCTIKKTVVCEKPATSS